jgi:hypothetical protein
MKICEVESCEEEACYYDEMDNMLCSNHMEQDMNETGNKPEYYESILNPDSSTESGRRKR